MRARKVVPLAGVVVSSICLGGCGATAHAVDVSTQTSTAVSQRASARGPLLSWGVFAGGTELHSGPGGRHTGKHHEHSKRSSGRHQKVGAVGAGRAGQPSAQSVAGVPGTISEIATSNSDTYALTSSGAVYALGSGGAGELGNGSSPPLSTHPVRVDFPTGVTIAKLPNPMPYDAGMAIDSHGDVWAWGNDASQEFCQPHGSTVLTPIKVPLSDVSLAVGAQRHAIYDADGKIVSCGLGSDGQLGNGTSGASSQTGTPVDVEGLPTGRVTFTAVMDISEGGSTTTNGQAMALLDNGQLWGWGANSDGQIGNGSSTDQLTPARVTEPSGVRFVKVNSGGASDYAISQTGQLWDWGSNQDGQLALGALNPKKVTRPTRTSLYLDQVSSTASNAAGLSGSGGA